MERWQPFVIQQCGVHIPVCLLWEWFSNVGCTCQCVCYGNGPSLCFEPVSALALIFPASRVWTLHFCLQISQSRVLCYGRARETNIAIISSLVYSVCLTFYHVPITTESSPHVPFIRVLIAIIWDTILTSCLIPSCALLSSPSPPSPESRR